MTEELRDIDSQGFGCGNDNFLWIFILLIILFCCCSGGIGGIFGGCGCEGGNDWLFILVIIGVIFFCCSGSGGLGNLFGGCF